MAAAASAAATAVGEPSAPLALAASAAGENAATAAENAATAAGRLCAATAAGSDGDSASPAPDTPDFAEAGAPKATPQRQPAAVSFAPGWVLQGGYLKEPAVLPAVEAHGAVWVALHYGSTRLAQWASPEPAGTHPLKGLAVFKEMQDAADMAYTTAMGKQARAPVSHPARPPTKAPAQIRSDRTRPTPASHTPSPRSPTARPLCP